MLKLKKLSDEKASEHLKVLTERFHEGLASKLAELAPSDYDADLLDFLTCLLEKILIGSASELETIALAVTGLFPSFSEFSSRKDKGKNPADNIYRNTLAIIESCFDYDRFSKRSDGWCAYALICAHDIRICPYCQAHHVNYHVDASATTLPGRYRIRPPLDHFLPQSRYPYLAVSLYNLIPSCAPCNSSIKSSKDPLLLGLVNPHDTEQTISIQFTIAGSIPKEFGGTVEDIKIGLITTGDPSIALADAFLLEERYQWYRHEVMDLIDRFAGYGKIPTELQSVIPPERYVVGCPIDQMESRMIGCCLRDIYTELKEATESSADPIGS